MKDYTVPIDLQSSLQERVTAFCKRNRTQYRYYVDARGKFIYLSRMFEPNVFERLGRVTYLGDSENMDFAIYKFSSGKYDPNERWFPGAEYLDGTIEGALKAIIAAYP